MAELDDMPDLDLGVSVAESADVAAAGSAGTRERPGFASQYDTLVDRNLALLFSSFRGLFLLLGQPVLLGYIIGLAWRNAEAEPTTYFSMTIAAVYLGCMNACCVIVRERAIYDRERMFDLSIWAYLLAKLMVLAVVSAVQSALLLYMQARSMHLPPGLANHATLYVVLTCASITASGLGLLISTCASSAYGAVIAVPSLIVPQIVFSEVVLRSHIDKKIPSIAENFTITKWCYDGLAMLADEIDGGILVKSLAVLALQLAAFLFLGAFKLKLDDL